MYPKSRTFSKEAFDSVMGGPVTGKPVIYLYPEEAQNIKIKLNINGEMTYTYPSYNNGWEVMADPNGRLINISDGTEHFYLFWEGRLSNKWDVSTGFLVAGEDTEKFLKEKLEILGLVPKEYNDFITYWVPQMKHNNYNIIHFSDLEEYSKSAQLDVSPKQDTILRIHMAWKSSDEYIEITEQELKTTSRNGFVLVEWGGTNVSD